MIELVERGNIKDPAVTRALEYLVARLKGLLTQAFDQDGQLIVANPNLAVFSVGDVKSSALAADHPGWLLADGREVSRVKYAELFRAFSTTYGAGNGVSTFNLPDYRGRFLLGKAASGTGNTLGATGGQLDHVHSVGAHTHSVSITSGGGGAHSHGGNTNSANANVSGTTGDPVGPSTFFQSDGGGDFALLVGNHQHSFSDGAPHAHGISSESNHTHSVSGSTASASGGDSGAANPAFAVVNMFIFSGVAA